MLLIKWVAPSYLNILFLFSSYVVICFEPFTGVFKALKDGEVNEEMKNIEIENLYIK